MSTYHEVRRLAESLTPDEQMQLIEDLSQMATAICEGASFFLTNDARLPSLPELEVLVLEELRT